MGEALAPRLAVFPKAFMDELCVSGAMRLEEWIRLGATLDVQGLELYAGFLDLRDPKHWGRYRRLAEREGLEIPMLCCSPDFTQPDPNARASEIARQKSWIDMAAALGAEYCRVLSGQARPEVKREEGLAAATEAIGTCLEYAQSLGITLVLENHFKDNYWTYPEFAQPLAVFRELLARIQHPHFGVNFDPSNALLTGDMPMTWLRAIRGRVVTMHASDRYLESGTLEALMRRGKGYASGLKHGEIGCGLIDYPAILAELKRQGFAGWISIEDGVEGMDQLHRSVAFLRGQISRVWTRSVKV